MNITDIASISKDFGEIRSDKASKDLESYFINFLLKEMRKTIPKSDLFGKNSAETMYTEMFDQQLAQNLADAGGLGLAKHINKVMAVQQKAVQGYEEANNLIQS